MSNAVLSKKVVIVQRRMTHYRIPIFNAMRERLAAEGVDLIVIFGDATPEEERKNDKGILPWGTYVPCRYFFGNRICWQQISPHLKDVDLIIVTQEVRQLYNFILHLRRRKIRMAYWGHGKNFQAANAASVAERIKKWITRHVDWWFAYTSETVRVVSDAGFPQSRITLLNNSIDTRKLHDEINSITDAEQSDIRKSIGLTEGPIGIMVGSLYTDKHVDFLLQAAALIHSKNPRFQLLIVGAGPDAELVKDFIRQGNTWTHWVGARMGRDKAVMLSLANVMLNPGLVGLGILDSFVARLPLITRNINVHSPEIAYLKSGFNGLMTNDSLNDYADAVVAYIKDDHLQEVLRQGCAISAQEYSAERMTANFCDGILRALKSR